jgi:prolyl-tRNA synthetase
LRDGDKVKSHGVPRDQFVGEAAQLLTAIQTRLFQEAKTRLDSNIRSDVSDFAGVAEYFGAAGDEDEASEFRGWLRVGWSRPSGAALDAVEQKLKQLKLSIRNAPQSQSGASLGKCIFTGEPATQEVLIARAY